MMSAPGECASTTQTKSREMKLQIRPRQQNDVAKTVVTSCSLKPKLPQNSPKNEKSERIPKEVHLELESCNANTVRQAAFCTGKLAESREQALRLKVSELEAEKRSLQYLSAKLQRKIASSNTNTEASEASHAQFLSSIDILQSNLDSAIRDGAEYSAEISKLKSEREVSKKELYDSRRVIAKQRQQLRELSKKLRECESSLTTASETLESRMYKLKTAKLQHSMLKQTLQRERTAHAQWTSIINSALQQSLEKQASLTKELQEIRLANQSTRTEKALRADVERCRAQKCHLETKIQELMARCQMLKNDNRRLMDETEANAKVSGSSCEPPTPRIRLTKAQPHSNDMESKNAQFRIKTVKSLPLRRMYHTAEVQTKNFGVTSCQTKQLQMMHSQVERLSAALSRASSREQQMRAHMIDMGRQLDKMRLRIQKRGDYAHEGPCSDPTTLSL